MASSDEFPAPEEMDDAALSGEVKTLARYEQSGGLTDEQTRRLSALRDEVRERADAAWPNVDYDGSEDDDG